MEAVEHLREELALLIVCRGEKCGEIGDIRRNAVDLRLRQHLLHGRYGRLARILMHDEFREHGVVERRDRNMRLEPRLDTGPRREIAVVDAAAAGAEIVRAILGVDTHLDGVPLRLTYLAREIRELARGLAHHPLHEIDAHDFLGDAMLDLQARVDLQEVESLRRFIVEEFHRARAAIGCRMREAHGRLIHLLPRGIAQMRCRGLLHDLLTATLHGAVALADGHGLALRIAEDLHFHVPRPRHVFLEKNARVVEVALREVAHVLVVAAQVILALADADADAATARRALEHDGIADAPGLPAGFLQPREQTRARQQRHAGLLRQRARRMLEAEEVDLRRRRADEGDTILLAGPCEVRVLAEEAVARMHGFGTRLFAGRDDLVDDEIRILRGAVAEADGLIGPAHVQAVPVGLGVDGDAAHAHAAQRALDAGRDGPAVGYQDFFKHNRCSSQVDIVSGTQSQISRRMGVGL